MFAAFFIDRPIFAVVISLVIVLAGGAALTTLPVAQYPEIAPPTVQVACNFPGASAQVVQESVAVPIEQKVNGVDNMLYMSSQCTNDGGYNLTVTFKLGTNLDIAQVLVQNRVSQALAVLPEAIKTTGITVKKRSPNIMLVVSLTSSRPDRYSQRDLSNFATLQLVDELARIEGVGDVNIFGQQDYSMRIWLNPEKLKVRDLTVGEVRAALQEQNVQVAAGQIGQPPIPKGQDYQYVMTTLGRLTTPAEFGEIVVRAGEGGGLVRLRDIARIERGSRSEDTQTRLDGKPSVGVAVFQMPGSNALATADAVKAKMTDLKKRFPEGIDYEIAYDTTPFIQESVDEVFKTLRDAVILVAIVVLLFLQDWRAMILPMIDVPVSLIGTLAVMYLLGFTLNNLTLFGLVLAIGIVVDDAIVVLENIERWMAKGLDARSATIKAMSEITGPIIAITLVLTAVFLPSAFLPGISGQFYRQFALTIAVSMMISAINAMTMTPSRAVMIFKGQEGDHAQHREALPRWGWAILGGWLTAWLANQFLGPTFDSWAAGPNARWLGYLVRVPVFLPGAIAGWFVGPLLNRLLGFVFRLFNRFFDWVTRVYGRIVGWSLRLTIVVLVLYVGLIGLTGFGFSRTPTGFVPAQDKGYLIVSVQLPDSASLERTDEVMRQIEDITRNTPGVAHTIAIPGQSFVLGAVSPNYGSMFVILQPFHDRHGADLYSEAIAARLRGRYFKEVRAAQTAVFGPPAVDGLGNAGGFKLMVEDLGGNDLTILQGQTDELARRGNEQPGLVGLFTGFRASTPQLFVKVDRTKAKSMGVPLGEVFGALQTFMGGSYVNDYNEFGRTWQVNVQGDAKYRRRIEDVRRIEVKNNRGEMVPLGSVVDVIDRGGPVMITRYNLRQAAAINGAIRPGTSSGTAIDVMSALSEETLPASMTAEWTELAYLQQQEGNAALYAFLGAVVLVFLILAAQYESWSMPLAVLLVVPMCLLSALAGILLMKLDVNIFVQVGLIVLVGLASKNAILIVEFARERRREGMSGREAAVEASKSRFRPIVMTSFAFILGVVPLMISEGAGAEMRRTLGVAVFSGMLGVTIFGVFLTPVFYYAIDWLTTPRTKTEKAH